MNITCLANAGHPEGKVIIWKQTSNADSRVELRESSYTDTKTEYCITDAYVTVSYSISKFDDGAFFGCTAQNKFTPEDSVPSRKIGPLNIFCTYTCILTYFMLRIMHYLIIATCISWYQIKLFYLSYVCKYCTLYAFRWSYQSLN